jgi:hypothetical protein
MKTLVEQRSGSAIDELLLIVERHDDRDFQFVP